MAQINRHPQRPRVLRIAAGALILLVLGLGARLGLPGDQGPIMRVELSAEDMRAPLRKILITAPPASRDILIAKLPEFAKQNWFYIRIVRDPAKPNDVFVQMYRSDIKIIGLVPAGQSRLELTLYRTMRRVPEAANEQVLSGLRKTFATIPAAHVEQTTFVQGDDMRLERGLPIRAVSIAIIKLSDSTRDAVKKQLVLFAKTHGFAAGFHPVTPDPDNINFEMYGEGIMMDATTADSNNELSVAIWRIGDRTASQAYIDQLMLDLRQQVVQIDGVSFTFDNQQKQPQP